MRSTVDLNGLPTLVAGAFLFGIVHAFMPGHGKTVLVSYHIGRPSRVIEGVATGTLLAITHVGCESAWVWRADQHPNLLILLFMGGQYLNADPQESDTQVALGAGLGARSRFELRPGFLKELDPFTAPRGLGIG